MRSAPPQTVVAFCRQRMHETGSEVDTGQREEDLLVAQGTEPARRREPTTIAWTAPPSHRSRLQRRQGLALFLMGRMLGRGEAMATLLNPGRSSDLGFTRSRQPHRVMYRLSAKSTPSPGRLPGLEPGPAGIVVRAMVVSQPLWLQERSK